MKKLIFIFCFAASFATNAQSFYKGALVADLTTGIDVYNVKYKYALRSNTSIDTTVTGSAGSRGPTIGLEYGVSKWLGLGLRAKIDNYYTEADKITGIKPSVKGFEIGALVDFHMVRKEHFNFFAGMELGYSNLLYKTNDAFGTEIYGSGSWFNFHLTPRYYFGRFGIGISLNFPVINYPDMTTSSKTINSYIVSSWKATGFGANFGIQYRFLNER